MKVCGIVNSKGGWQSKSPTIIPFSPILTIDLADDIQEFVLSIHQSKVTPAAPPTP
jgi:hypothetical protein